MEVVSTTPAVNPTSASTLNLVDEIAAFIERFVFLSKPSLYRLAALWIIHTYFMDEFEYTGYIFAYSPEPASGKTRFLNILDLLVHNSSGILSSPTEAILFRTARGHTQLLDEADTWMNTPQLKGVLNSGFQRGGKVARMDKQSDGGYKAGDHQVFAPRAIAGIGPNILPPATRTRTFQFKMLRNTADERRERFRSRQIRPITAELVSRIRNWAIRNKAEVIERYGQSFPCLEKFGDRTMDVCEPLAAILEVVYRDSTELDQARLDFLDAIATTREEQTELIFEHRVLSALMAEAKPNLFPGPLVGTASELAERCRSRGVDCDEMSVSRTLRSYGFSSKSIRLEDGSKRRYSLSFEELSAIASRYLQSAEPASAA
jgi:hypothetical protein